MTIPVHETAQGWIAAYTGGWSDITGTPNPRERWLSPDEAHERYESPEGVFVVVEASDRDDEAVVRARWAFGITRREMVRAQFFDPAGSILASTTYTAHDGRLFIVQRYDYTYPDAATRHRRSGATQTVGSYFNPDGTGTFEVKDKRTGDLMRTRFKDADFSTLWFDWPAFGDWDTFADPEHGILPHDFTMTPL